MTTYRQQKLFNMSVNWSVTTWEFENLLRRNRSWPERK